ncbi:hypothetical protein BKA67DRAFT_662224 [Truncatella angustata]|uniref:Uncharacterized protein n=1 Tax=Truncatella angustata TaxID=152316 RepID=A0A9P8RNU6_9PEZI|nr:uncharacterized protein BKA67DRAFT_662224 [Truncatella angustata]KAH6647433.1 hypothetical protein BKA67DRAFT_662224 [Truncatella angustata]KAH8195042.1 hypothetical protein TruAng_010797 [Truncatella angustata]
MKFFFTIALASAATTHASPVEIRGSASGCYAYQNPGCGIDYAVCQCANGWMYQYNTGVVGGCDPPWGFLATSANGLGGWTCN